MKVLFLVFISLVTVVRAPKAWSEGTSVGNGGVTVVCRNLKGTILSVQLLDLFEGENLKPKLLYSKKSFSSDEFIRIAEDRMKSNPTFLKVFQAELMNVRSNVVELNKLVGLQPTNDAFPVINKKGCKFEQLANYRDQENTIYLDREISDQLDQLNKAAFYVHEVSYSLSRRHAKDTNSIRARKLTMHLLADNGTLSEIESLMSQILGQKTVLLPDQKRATTGEIFTRVKKYPDLGEAWMDPSGLIWGDAVLESNGKVLRRGHNFPKAKNYCTSIGARLPTLEEFYALRKYLGYSCSKHSSKNGQEPDPGACGYLAQILPHLDSRYWTSSRDDFASNMVYTFWMDSGEINITYYDDPDFMSVRCVIK